MRNTDCRTSPTRVNSDLEGTTFLSGLAVHEREILWPVLAALRQVVDTGDVAGVRRLASGFQSLGDIATRWVLPDLGISYLHRNSTEDHEGDSFLERARAAVQQEREDKCTTSKKDQEHVVVSRAVSERLLAVSRPPHAAQVFGFVSWSLKNETPRSPVGTATNNETPLLKDSRTSHTEILGSRENPLSRLPIEVSGESVLREDVSATSCSPSERWPHTVRGCRSRNSNHSHAEITAMHKVLAAMRCYEDSGCGNRTSPSDGQFNRQTKVSCVSTPPSPSTPEVHRVDSPGCSTCSAEFPPPLTAHDLGIVASGTSAAIAQQVPVMNGHNHYESSRSCHKLGVQPEWHGSIRLYVSHYPCISCLSALCQFSWRFPNIRISLAWDSEWTRF
ncbi:unnamed protein product [Amoebophrya sp. A25]|nr:unnamed protein product [Amoebophrya sp. A25]|eukprot:GSA25T00024154001.1